MLESTRGLSSHRSSQSVIDAWYRPRTVPPARTSARCRSRCRPFRAGWSARTRACSWACHSLLVPMADAGGCTWLCWAAGHLL